jgi:hypothetical protein
MEPHLASIQVPQLLIVYFVYIAQEKVFGSKFVTVCVTGNKEHEIHMEGYQVGIQYSTCAYRFLSCYLPISV